MPRVLLTAVALAAFGIGETSALDLDFYLENRDRAEVQAYLQGVAEGAGWAMAFAPEKAPKAFCAPDDKAHSRDEYLALLDAYVAGHPEATGYPVEMILLLALADRYPC